MMNSLNNDFNAFHFYSIALMLEVHSMLHGKGDSLHILYYMLSMEARGEG